jgi:ferrochelatase
MPGLLLINLGTPAAPTTSAVRRYLAEFLADERVLTMNPIARALLLYGAILPFRSPKSAAAYQKIWTDQGSPLLVHGQALAKKLRVLLGGRWCVEFATRYGKPNIAEALDNLLGSGAEPIIVFPLYPQYASSSTGSTLAKVFELASARPTVPALRVIPDYYAEPRYIDALTTVTRPHLESFQPDHVLFSVHGLPESHVKATDDSGTHCLANDGCCDAICQANRSCYRAQCMATSRLLAASLGLEAESWSTTFQSRLGREPWIRPFSDEWVPKLAKMGVKRLAVLCPSFTADCLETLEEVGIRLRESFEQSGGEELCLVPCLNDHDAWAQGLCEMVLEMVP